MPPPYLKFNYTNWKGEDHTYVVLPTALAYKSCEWEKGEGPSMAWSLNAQVITRDGETRPTTRTFRLDKMRDVEEVDRGSI